MYATSQCRAITWGILLAYSVATVAAEESSRVVLKRAAETSDYQLFRNGERYSIRGVGGQVELDLLQQLGGNSVRTWGADNLGALLDAAHQRGLTVCVGMWLGHPQRGFDYSSGQAVVAQLDSCLKTVERFKSHPAVLLWGIGNEMEEGGDNPAVWYAVDHIAREIKRIDPNHPTMTVIAELGEHKVESLHRFCPHIDIVGINAYGSIVTVAQRYREQGGSKPYIITEHGPRGPWESPKTTWGAPIEATSTAKSKHYAEGYRHAVAKNPRQCLGSYSFLWGNKQETTATWFGMLLPDGTRLAAADAMSEKWTGQPVANRCCEIRELNVGGVSKLAPGQKFFAAVEASDPEGDKLEYQWVLRSDAVVVANGNDAQAAENEVTGAIVGSGSQVEVHMPAGGGGYRLFVYVRDGHGGGAVANVPLYVDAPIKPIVATRAKLPLVVYAEGTTSEPYTPSGFMGNTQALEFDLDSTVEPHAGDTCLRVKYNAPDQWGGVVWQSPANDWKGQRPGGFDLSEAAALEFWARGETGAERVTFLVGLNTTDGVYRDTGKTQLADVQLTTEWKRYRIPLSGVDLGRIKNGFGFSLAGQGRAVTFYLDDVRYVE
ncbi:glycoside hydrolase family 2 TIM barrel-domain containing protein [Aeoliella sp.]|uniref:glycoside hydrolase family 2 TIM barrel-domain containing protein n=1 Tax=Aeoliella sp. TaxID=2795800 RepID=UPI003CCBB281